ncbi:MAG TPA: MFS transporter [Burkholderiaceae bacterium]|mgnify:CR=1 FL=1|nr:MFS transporter [Burkholderiaceae bacterium]
MLPPAEIRRVIIGLLLAMFLGAIDGTIVAVSLLTIAGELGTAALMSWVVSGYLVASTIVTPIYGKLSDLYGRKRLLSIAIIVSMSGSLMCALAQTMPQLIAFRVIQGLGGGGLIALSQATVADVAPGPERGKYQAYFSGVFALAAVLGPMLGGYLSHYLSWRAIFWINLPLAAAAFLVARRALDRLPVRGGRHQIDYAGAALLAIGVAALLIALTRIGQGIGWTAPSTLWLLALSALFLAACGWQETRASEPILSPVLFRNRTVMLCCVIVGLNFFVLIGCSVLLPMMFQSVGGTALDDVAARMLPLTVMIPIGAFFAGQLMVRRVECKTLVQAGTAAGVAMLIAISLTPATSVVPMALFMTVLGLSIGMPMSASLVAAQLAVPPERIGITTATNAFFRSLGGAIGVAILSSLLWSQLRSATPPGLSGLEILGHLKGRTDILQHSYQRVFWVAAGASLAAWLLGLWLPRKLWHRPVQS